MKHYYLLIFLLFSAFSFSQVPTGYYDSASGSGFALKTQLKQIIDNTNDGLTTEYQSVDNGYDGLYTAYQTTDIDNFTTDIYENDGTVLDMYSESESTTMGDSYNFNHSSTDQCGNYTGEGQCYNREHIFAQGFFNELLPMRSDVHFVPPTDGYVNNRRSNYPFGIVTSPTWTSQNGSKVGANTSSLDYTGSAFEPIDEYKGDIARMLLYFAVRYENEVTSGSWDAHDAVPENPLNGTNNQVYEDWYIELLLDWHSTDPVSPREISRNNACFTFQNNRNPFVDHPEYANAIWSSGPADTQAPTIPTNLVTSNPSSSTMDLSWTASTDDTAVTSYDVYVDGSFYVNTGSATSTYTVTGLTAETTYSFTVLAKDAANNMSTQSTAADGTTIAGSSGGTDCATEDFENIPANDGAYAVRTWTGTNGDWTATDARTDQILTGRAITIRNGSLTSPTVSDGIGELTVTTQLVFSGSAGTFDVKVNGTSVGTIPYSSAVQTTTIPNINVQGNITVVFDSNSSASNRVRFDDLSWTCNSTLGIDEDNFVDVKFYPNPLNGNSLYLDTNQTLNIEIFNVLGKRIISDKVNANKNHLNLSDLNSGIYLIRISNGKQTITKKLIRQ